MNLNLDEILGWKLTVTVNHQTYKTRPPSLGDLATIESLKGNKLGAETLGKLGASLLLTDAAPDLSPDQWMAVFLAVMDYWKGRVQKNEVPIVERIQSAMGKAKAE